MLYNMAKLLYCAKFCFWFSLFACVSLVSNIQSLLGITLMVNYNYIHISSQNTSGTTCFFSALIYFAIGALCLIYIKTRQRTHIHIPTDSF